MFVKLLLALISLSVAKSLLVVKQTEECCEEYCYEEDTTRDQYKHLGSKSPYSLVKGTDNEIYNIEGCSAEKIRMLIRYGTRLPSPQSMLQLQDLEKLRDDIVFLYNDTASVPEKGRLCESDLNLIKNWKWDTNITAEYDEYLTIKGWNELKELAKEYKNAFPDVFPNFYSSESFRFSYTDYQRTEASYKAFVEGLFGDGSYNDFTLDRLPNPNRIMSPMDFCEAYNENVIVQNGPNSEKKKFRNSDIFQAIRRDISTKVGFSEPAHQPLSDETILNIYEMCRFDKAWNPTEPSPWCSVLTETQVKVLEYYDDLDLYMRTSYGSEVTSNLACFGVDDMLTHLSTIDSPKVVAYFGHIAIHHAHLATMGAFKDSTPLRSDNYHEMMNRKFKTIEICPFAANFAAVKYSCPHDAEATEKVKFFLNQKTVTFDWCGTNGVCKLSDLLVHNSLCKDCNCADIFCSTNGSSGNKSSINLVAILFFSFYLAAALKRK